MAKQQRRAAIAERATLELQKSVAWRTLDKQQEAFLIKELTGKKLTQEHFVILNWDDPEEMQYFLYINNVCLRLNINCLASRMRLNPFFLYPPPGLFFFAYADADQTFINALKAAGLITGDRVGTAVGDELFPQGVRQGIVIGPRPNPLNPGSRPEDELSDPSKWR